VLEAENLDSVRAGFVSRDAGTLAQLWQQKLDSDFTPATVCVGWRGNSLLVFAELDDTSHALFCLRNCKGVARIRLRNST
jgi:hypothetical protein